MVNYIPGLATPWPDPRTWPVTRRLLAAWRWESENHASGYANARASVEARASELGVSVFEGSP